MRLSNLTDKAQKILHKIAKEQGFAVLKDDILYYIDYSKTVYGDLWKEVLNGNSYLFEHMYPHKGDIAKIPHVAIDRLCKYQKTYNASVFERNNTACSINHGVTWRDTREGDDFWRNIMNDRWTEEVLAKELKKAFGNYRLAYKQYTLDAMMEESARIEPPAPTYKINLSDYDLDVLGVVDYITKTYESDRDRELEKHIERFRAKPLF